MRFIDMQAWSRREHFKAFNASDKPHFSLCANLHLTTFYPAVEQRALSFTVAMVYVVSRAANAIPEFRYRIRGDKVVEHDIVHPSTSILGDDDLFTFCMFDYVEDFSEFAARAAERIAYVREHPTLEDDPGRDDLLFLTSIPWVSFTSFVFPGHLHPADSIPQFAWGKFFKEGKFTKIPLGVQAHHALVDGIHIGKFYEKVQDYLYWPDLFLGEVGRAA
jgi:chloramphenicol O-acetyltransferase type A